MNESFITVDGGKVFAVHSQFEDGRPTILFIHGLGESSLCFREAFSHPAMSCFNLIAPDLLGFGRSSGAEGGDYSFETQIRRLWEVCERFGVQSVGVVGHSMGGDDATIMASTAQNRRVRALINAEGDLTPHDLFISNRAVQAAQAQDFDRWLKEEFMEETVLGRWAREWPATCVLGECAIRAGVQGRYLSRKK